MKFNVCRLCLPLLVVVALFGCGGPLIQWDPNPMTFSHETMGSGLYESKYDNVLFLMDTWQGMDNDGQEKLQSATYFLDNLIMSLPEDFSANVGLRVFGHNQQNETYKTALVYGMAPYSRNGLQQAVQNVKLAWESQPLADALDAAAIDLENATGKSAIVIVSDGTWKRHAPIFATPAGPAAAQAIKEKMGEKLCIYTVWIGDVNGTQKALEMVAEAGGCGFAENGKALTEPAALSAYVEKVFLDRKLAPAPAPPVVPAPVSAMEVVTFNLLFGFDKHEITDDMIPVLEKAKTILTESPAASFSIQGHTCSVGTDEYNQKLSERRAASVYNWLSDNGIAAGRLEVVGFGESQPKFGNDTMEGRKLNRRVEIHTK